MKKPRLLGKETGYENIMVPGASPEEEL